MPRLRLGTTEQDRLRYRWLMEALCKWYPQYRGQLEKLMRTRRGVMIDLKPVPLEQTDKQRGYYWRSLHFWGAELGYSARESENELHNAVCCEAFGVRSRVKVRGIVREIPKTTSSTLNREDYSLLTSTMIRMAAQEHDVQIPPPKTKDEPYGCAA